MRLEECNTNWFPVSWIPSNWICFSRGFFFLFCALLLSQGGLKGEGCHGFLEKVNGRMSVLCEEDERCSCSLCVDDGKCQGQSQSVKPWPVFEFINDVLQRDIGKGVRRGTMNYEGWKYLHEFCYIISNLSSWIFLVNKD